MSRSKKVAFTKEVKQFIIDKMAEGMDIASITKKYPDEVPAAATIYRESNKDKEFREDLNQAYTILLMHRLDELHDVASENWCKDRVDYFGGDYKMAFEARRAKMDELKFMMGKMAPILSKRFDKADKIEVKGDLAPQIVVMNYSTDIPKPIREVIDEKELIDSLPEEDYDE